MDPKVLDGWGFGPRRGPGGSRRRSRPELGSHPGHAAGAALQAPPELAEVRPGTVAGETGGDPRVGPSDRPARSPATGSIFWVLRRYHDWLNSLPEIKQDELLAQPPDDRMALIRKLVVQYAVPTSETPEFLRIAEVGELSPFELASAFRIWQASNSSQREHDRTTRTHGTRSPQGALPAGRQS